MARSQQIITNFTAGELSPRVLARVDVDRYANGCEILKNMIVLPHGGAKRRAGMHWVAETRDSTKQSRLIKFQFSTSQTYAMEFGEGYVRFYSEEGVIVHTAASTDAWATTTAYAVGDFVNDGTLVYRCIQAHTSSASDEPGVGAAWETYWVQDNTLEIVSPYQEADLPYLRVAQTGDIMYFASPDYPLYKLTRFSSIDWTLEEAPIVNGPFLDLNTDSTHTITASATTGTVILTASKATWAAGHVGAYWYLKDSGGTAGYVEITGFTSSTQVTATVLQTLGGTTATDIWAEGAWSEVQGYPYDVTFLHERLVALSTDGRPESVWGSVVGDFEDFAAGVADDDAWIYEILSEDVNVGQWITTNELALVIGTGGNEFSMSGGGENQPITPSNVLARKETNWGSAASAPVAVASEVLHVSRSRRKVRALAPGLGLDKPLSRDLTFIAEHITEGGLLDITYAQDPDSVVWGNLADGKFIGATYEPTEQVLGWHRHETDGAVESLLTIPYGEESQLWAIVKRTVNGVEKRYVEFFDPDLNTDSALLYEGAATSTLAGLDHLEGETLKVRADEAEHPDVVVTGGQITLDYEATKVEAGLGYQSQLRPVRLEGGNPAGTAQGRKRRWGELFVRLVQSAYPTINGELPPTRGAADTMDEPPPLVTGDISVQSLGWDRDGYVDITHDRPLPLQVVGIFGTMSVEHGG